MNEEKAYWISAIIVIILIIAGIFAFNKHQQQENDVQSIRKKSLVRISLHSSSMAGEAAIILKKK
ncbi:hypothetical protein ODV19_02870 [Lactobacillus amylovorus]|uniref:Uncharacterized protein n=1 Tax=Lactobacillus amylovorus TaxID=1604 RepID=A0AAW6B8P5_LACAM|nr:hypothetical protein [Lactobacillus amylovorus]MDA6088965.1 hypothetical protein [Lactobacillus amylovorus]MDB6222345.1 hypothetical protein [Lactobacillus amylovorus]MDB6246164.1 hypothetical protein [Lactobacillus amylovorus]